MEELKLNTIEEAIADFREGKFVIVVDDEDRENEGDLIFPAETITPEQMAKLIRYGSGIVCLCITDEQCKQLDLPPMVEHNNSVNKTAFTVTIEAAEGVSTGVSAQDRVTTIKAAIADHAKPGERFKFTIDRTGKDKLYEVLKGAYDG